MRILFLFILLFSWVSTSLYADSEIGLEEKQAQNECLYKGQEVTVQNVLAEELHQLSKAVEAAVKEYYVSSLLSEVDYQHLPEGSLLRRKLQKRNVFIQNKSVALNNDFHQSIADINNHFASQICFCDQCVAAIEVAPSVFKARIELYEALAEVVSDGHVLQSPFLLAEVRDCLPVESLWGLKIDTVIAEQGQERKESIWTEFVYPAVIANGSSPRFHDPFADKHR